MKPTPNLKSLAATVALIGSALLFAPARAQQPSSNLTDADETLLLPEVTVTGTNISRLDVEKVLPVSILDRADIDVRDASQPSDLLTAIPQVTGLPGNETAFAGAAARGDNASVSLRGIPSSNTLILLNGRRLAPHPISQGEAGTPTLSVNVNQLPNRGLEQVEVLRDGASSIYGTDAVAGVVNYRTQRRFVGSSVALRFGETKYHDGQEFRATVTEGLFFAGGKGHIEAIADFFNRQAMFSRNRPFGNNPDNTFRAPAPWNVSTNTTFNLLSTSSAYGSFILGTPTATDAYGSVSTFAGARPTGVPAAVASATGVFVITPLAGGGVGFATAAPARTATGPGHDYYWNNSNYRVIQPQSTRGNVFLGSEYAINDRISAFSDLSMYQAHSKTYREPDAYSQSTDGFLVVPTSNPYNPFGDRFYSVTGAPNADGTPRLTGTPSAVSITNKRFTDLATRADTVTDSVYRGVVGLRGKLIGSWTWEAALLYSTARGIEYEAGATRRSLLAAAVNQTDPAKAFNPFTRTFAVQNGAVVVTGDYRNPQSVISTFQAPFIRNGLTKLGSGDFRVNGDVFEIWGGNKIGAAAGGEFRYEGFDDYRPPYAGLNPANSGLDPTGDDFVSFSPNADTHGNRHVAALYAETIVPVVGKNFQLPLVQSLELSASARYESYTDFGSTTKPKYSVAWRPLSWVLVRGSYNEGFHAPNLAQLFTGTLTRTILSSTDTYRNIVTNLATDGPSNRKSIASGNRNLKPESSTGKSAGIVFDVPHVRGFSISVDYWEIRQKDVISTGGGIPDDTAALLAATRAALAAGKTIDNVDLGSGTAKYLGDPSVARLAVTQADRDLFSAYNATQVPGNQRAVVGAINYVSTTYFNKSQQFLNGFDLDANYRLPKLSFGDFVVDSSWTYLNDFHAYTAAGAPRTDYRSSNSANVGGATPVWRGSSTLTWRLRQFGAGIGMYYIARYTDANAATTQAIYDSLGDPSYIKPVYTNGAYVYRYVVHDTKTYNAYVSYALLSRNRWLNHTSFRFGAVNLFNAKPPLVSGTSQGYETALYNNMARGLSYSVEVEKRF